MKRTFKIKLDDEELTVSVERQGDQLVVERDGQSYQVTPIEDTPRPNVSRPATSGQSQADGGRTAGAAPHSPRPVASPSSTPSATPPPPAASGAVPAPVTGTVKEVLASVGDNISAGERVMMMEAMKMDIEIVSPSSGKIKEVFVKAGDSVKENQPLLSIE